MSKLAERALAGTTEGHIELGEQLTWRAKHFGFTYHMISEITEMDRPRRFVDEQVAGPFNIGDMSTHSRQRQIAPAFWTESITQPFGLLGLTVDRLVLNRYLTKLMPSGTNSSSRRQSRRADRGIAQIN